MTLPPQEAAALGQAPAALALWQGLRAEVLAWPGVTLKAQKSQIGLWAAHPFAAVWVPGLALGREAAPLVVSVFARDRLAGPWKEVVEAAPGRFTHHAELRVLQDLTPALLAALRQAEQAAR